jgi:hypothetical protein
VALKYWLVALILFPCACAASLPPSAQLPVDQDQMAIQAAIIAWRNADLPWSDACSEQYDRIRVVVSAPGEFTELCGRKPLHAGGRLYACNTEQYEHAFPLWVVDDARVPLLVISELQPEAHRKLLVVHETMHWLERCSGKGIDFDHADATVWQGARIEAQRAVIFEQQARESQERQMWAEREAKHAPQKQAHPARSAHR